MWLSRVIHKHFNKTPKIEWGTLKGRARWPRRWPHYSPLAQYTAVQSGCFILTLISCFRVNEPRKAWICHNRIEQVSHSSPAACFCLGKFQRHRLASRYYASLHSLMLCCTFSYFPAKQLWPINRDWTPSFKASSPKDPPQPAAAHTPKGYLLKRSEFRKLENVHTFLSDAHAVAVDYDETMFYSDRMNVVRWPAQMLFTGAKRAVLSSDAPTVTRGLARSKSAVTNRMGLFPRQRATLGEAWLYIAFLVQCVQSVIFRQWRQSALTSSSFFNQVTLPTSFLLLVTSFTHFVYTIDVVS